MKIEKLSRLLSYLRILPVLFWAIVAVVGEVVGAEELAAGVAFEREEVEAVAGRVGGDEVGFREKGQTIVGPTETDGSGKTATERRFW